ncbi:hypothetical protein Q5752_004042 [Cryptotrichosporon argae]
MSALPRWTSSREALLGHARDRLRADGQFVAINFLCDSLISRATSEALPDRNRREAVSPWLTSRLLAMSAVIEGLPIVVSYTGRIANVLWQHMLALDSKSPGDAWDRATELTPHTVWDFVEDVWRVIVAIRNARGAKASGHDWAAWLDSLNSPGASLSPPALHPASVARSYAQVAGSSAGILAGGVVCCTFLPSHYEHAHDHLVHEPTRDHIQAGPSLYRDVRLARTPPLQPETKRRPTYHLPLDVAAGLAPSAPTWQPKLHPWDETPLFDAMNDPGSLLSPFPPYTSSPIGASAWPATAMEHTSVGEAECTQALGTYRHIQAALAYVRPRTHAAPAATDPVHTMDALLQYANDGIMMLAGRSGVDEAPRSAKRPAEAPPEGKAARGDKVKVKPVCQACGATETPEWRRGPLGPRTLCNACGLVHMKMLRKKKKQDEKAAAAAAAAAAAGTTE